MSGSVPLEQLDDALRGGAVAIGNFDGVHRGHQAVLGRALASGKPAVALTFEPHPRDHFGRGPVFRLTPPAMKAEVIGALGLDATVVADFDGAFAALSADEFVERVLVSALGARTVVVGEDFSYGARRTGTVSHLCERADAQGFAVEVVGQATAQGGAISSSRVREHLGEGRLAQAADLLGYRYRVAAKVEHGYKRGRTMGFPTTNQRLSQHNGLRHGVYAVRVLIDGASRDGVASFGRRPTFDNGAPLLESFIFDFDGELYGRTLTVVLVDFLRPEQRFGSMDELIAQMAVDSDRARAALAGLAPISGLDARLNF